MKQSAGAATLVVIGIHREELAFGREVVRGLSTHEVDVLEISEGLSGRRPLPDQSFRHQTLHAALYLQLPPHLRPQHRLLIDLHSGFDALGPSADLISADVTLCECLRIGVSQVPGLEYELEVGVLRGEVRIVPLGDSAEVHARTVIPQRIWDNPAFTYLGLELYLPETVVGHGRSVRLAQHLIRLAAAWAASPARTLTAIP